MSENFEMLVDTEVSNADAPAFSDRVLQRFREMGLIAGEPNGECVLGGVGYRPGPALAEVYVRGGREGTFPTYRTCGVEPVVGRGFNCWALGPVWEGFTCRACAKRLEPAFEQFGDSLSSALKEWLDESGPALLACPRCHAVEPITDWISKPPIGFGHLGFKFWNWPPLDGPGWKLDIIQLLREITGHTIVRTYGHI